MTGFADRHQHLFIVRTWREPSSVVATAEWRGLVEHVPTGQKRYFTRMEELDRFILQQMDQLSNEASTSEASEQ
jgi:hypothetical protein